ncbi:hypothetical protein Rsub_09317 [Raphidocelis subcapitata]|uniref:Uncharacterized protein n=1 Tax=Raphidocelis subcapitata TaxID=307507 RepID=A0A2V0PA14_9CHLO|nr:hypothetical protein Rsub_09317 [Raphidocelis subcapitata]|eukprot:GBF96684.1 hypothetical protein Rsub_09317 [Raphidocelis subcapitata]
MPAPDDTAAQRDGSGAAAPAAGDGPATAGAPAAGKQPRRRGGPGPQSDPLLELTPLEQERLRRIAENEAKLKSLGLDEPPPLLAARPPRAPRAAPAAAAGGGGGRRAAAAPAPEPTRQSKRQRGEAPEIQYAPRPAPARPSAGAVEAAAARRLSRGAQDGDAAEHDSHNLYRLRTMSEKALITRARRITIVAKLVSFIALLEEMGLDVVAEAARDRLQELTGCGAYATDE